MRQPATVNSGNGVKGDQAQVRVVIVDDHELFRTGLRGLLEEEDVDVVGEAADPETALSVVAETAPDVVVMDINMPGGSGIEATRRIRRESPACRVLMLSISTNHTDVSAAIEAGASGYVLKDSAVEDIVEGVRATARGQPKFSSLIADRMGRE
jgi:DNA-binding NarL/FixJ family response regulator